MYVPRIQIRLNVQFICDFYYGGNWCVACHKKSIFYIQSVWILCFSSLGKLLKCLELCSRIKNPFYKY